MTPSQQDGAGGAATGPTGGAGDSILSPHPTTPSILSTLASLGVPVAQGDQKQPVDLRYTVVEQLAQGGMGVIFKVRDEDLRRDLAMKVLHRGGGDGDGGGGGEVTTDPRYLGRFLEEAQVSGQLDHPGVVPIHELGIDGDGRLFFTMRLVRGRTLAEIFTMARRDQNGWSITRALGVLLKVCEAMAYAHHKRVIHRDLKPANIMVGRFGETYVMDWGLAKLLDESGHATGGNAAGHGRSTLSVVHTDRKEMTDTDGSTSLATLDGDIVGTPAYMAPEQARGQLERMGPCSDIYAVGALLYDLLAGHPPYLGDDVRASPHTILRWVIEGPPVALAKVAPERPAELAAICERAMAREPEERYGSMLELAEDIQAFIENRVVAAHQTGAVAEFRKWVVRNKGMAASIAAALLVALVGLGAVGWVQAQGKRDLAAKADELAASNDALGAANDELGRSNDALAALNVDLSQANAAAQAARDEALANEQLAQANAERALASEAEVLRQSYVANLAAAGSALESGAAGAARRHLAATDPALRGWEWDHLNLAADSSLSVIEAHDSLVWAVAYSPDGRLIASGSGPWGDEDFGGDIREVRLWDAASGALRHVLEGHQGTVTGVAFTPDGETLVTTCSDGKLRRFSVDRGRPLGIPRYVGGELSRPHVLPDGNRIAYGTRDADVNVLEVWNQRTLDSEFRQEFETDVRTVTVSPDGQRLVAGFGDDSVVVWDLGSGELQWSWTLGVDGFEQEISGQRGVTDLDVSPDGRTLIAVSRGDNSLRAFDLATGRLMLDHGLVRGQPTSCAFGPDGRLLLVGDISGAMQFFDARTYAPLEVLNGHDQFLTCLDFRPDGQEVVSCSWDGTVRTWDARPGAATLSLQSPSLRQVGYAEAGQLQLVFGPDGTTLVWDAGATAAMAVDAWTGEPLFDMSGAWGDTVAFTPDGSRILEVNFVEGLRVRDALTGRRLPSPTAGSFGSPWTSAFNRERSLVAITTHSRGSGPMSRRADIYIVETGELAQRLEGAGARLGYGSFTLDSSRYLAGAEDGLVYEWDVASGELLRTFDQGHSAYRVLMLPDGQRFVTTSDDPSRSALCLWDLESGELIRSLRGRSLFVEAAMGPRGERFFTANMDGTLGVWDLEQGEILSLPASDLQLVAVAMSPDGRRVAATDSMGRLRIWETVPPAERAGARRLAQARERLLDEVRPRIEALREEHLIEPLVAEALEAEGLPPETLALALRTVEIEGSDYGRIHPFVTDVGADPQASEAELREALRICDAMVEETPDFAQAFHARAWLHYRMGNLLEARLDMAGVDDADFVFYNVDPRVYDALRALIAAGLGEVDAARRALLQVQALDRSPEQIWDGPDERLFKRRLAEAVAVVSALGDGR